MVLESGWWVTGGIVVLAVAMILALVSRHRWGRVEGETGSHDEGEGP